MFSCRYPINRPALSTDVADCRDQRKKAMSSVSIDKKRSNSGAPRESLAKRRRTSAERPRRIRRTVKRFEPQATKFIDDDEDEEGSDSCGDSALEQRSEDSGSEGSLKDFIVSDDEESTKSYHSSTNEEELSSYETSSESQFSLYSDED